MSLRVFPSENNGNPITFIGFNQDYGCFAVGMQNGFRVFDTDPLRQLENYEFNACEGTGVGFVEMLFRTSFLGLLGGGNHSKIPYNTACIWDCVEQEIVLELSYANDVRAIRLRKDLIVVVLTTFVKIYTFGSCPELSYQSETVSNPQGLCHVCHHPDNPVIAFPGRQVGVVTLITLPPSTAQQSATSTPRYLKAHRNPLVALTMSGDGKQIATASQRGTLIRVFCTRSFDLLHELRRGSNAALITSIAFDHITASSAIRRLAVASDHGTVHIFNLNLLENETSRNVASSGGFGGYPPTSRRLSLGYDHTSHVPRTGRSGSLLPRYFSATFSQIRCALDHNFKAVCAFSPSNPDTLIALAADGTYSKYAFTPNGVVTREQSVNFLDFYDDESDL